MDKLALERAQLIAEFDSERGYELDGATGTVAWLKTFCRLSAASALEITSVAQRLHALPMVEWCDGHHVERYRAGNTVKENGALLCGFHHRLVHEGGWRLTKERGELAAISPYGEKFKSAKAPPAA